MAINLYRLLPRSWAAKLGYTPPPEPKGAAVTNDQQGARLNSGRAPANYLDGTERVRPSTVPTRAVAVNAVAADATEAPKKKDPFAPVAAVLGTTAQVAGTGAGIGLAIWGGLKVFAAFGLATLSIPAFAAGVGIVAAGAAVIKLSGMIGKASRSH